MMIYLLLVQLGEAALPLSNEMLSVMDKFEKLLRHLGWILEASDRAARERYHLMQPPASSQVGGRSIRFMVGGSDGPSTSSPSGNLLRSSSWILFASLITGLLCFT